MGKVTIWADGLMAALTTAPFTSMPTAMRRNYTARACATHARAWLSLADAPGRAHARHGGLCRAPRACGVAGATPGIAKPHSCTHTRRFGGVPAAKSHRIVQKRKNGAPPPMKMATGIHPAKIMPMPSTARMAPSQADNGDGSPLVIQIMGSITTGAIEPRMAAVPAS